MLLSFIQSNSVTPPTRHPMGCQAGVSYFVIDCDSLTFSFSELTPAFICTIYVITKFFLHIHYTYHHNDIHYILYTYTRVPLLVLLQFHYYKTIHIKSDIAEAALVSTYL